MPNGGTCESYPMIRDVCRLFQQLCSGDVGWHGEHGVCQLEASIVSSACLDHHLRLSHQRHSVAWKGSLFNYFI